MDHTQTNMTSMTTKVFSFPVKIECKQCHEIFDFKKDCQKFESIVFTSEITGKRIKIYLCKNCLEKI